MKRAPKASIAQARLLAAIFSHGGERSCVRVVGDDVMEKGFVKVGWLADTGRTAKVIGTEYFILALTDAGLDALATYLIARRS